MTERLAPLTQHIVRERAEGVNIKFATANNFLVNAGNALAGMAWRAHTQRDGGAERKAARWLAGPLNAAAISPPRKELTASLEEEAAA